MTPVDFGDLRRTEPVSRFFGLDRGTPVDRYYIEAFLERHRDDVHGVALEFGDDAYARRFGGARTTRIDVLYPHVGHARATVIADLADAPQLPDASYDCIVCTQVLTYVFDVRSAIATLHRILKPGGVLLASVPGISQLSRHDADAFGEYWRFTTHSARRLFGDAFGGAVTVEAKGNVLASLAFLHGFAVEEMTPRELDVEDRDYEMIVLVRAQKRP